MLQLVKEGIGHEIEMNPTSPPPEISIRQLSTPRASSAESRCSTVRTVAPPLDSVVQRRESETDPADAMMRRRQPSCTSSATKKRPSPAAAGKMAAVVRAPEWRPTPVRATDEARVCCGLPI